MSDNKPVLYQSWFCPFAQRAKLALGAKGVDYELVEVDPYNKSADWLSISPSGLIPVLRHRGQPVWESTVVVQYVDEAYPDGPLLLPKDPLDRAKTRIWVDHFNKHVNPNFFRTLQKETNEERKQSMDDLLAGLLKLVKAMDPVGPFFSGDQFGFVDIMLYPDAQRYFILNHYRGFEVPKTSEFERFHKWYEAANKLDFVQKTLVDKQKLIEFMAQYADNTATSEAAEAVRKGTAIP